MIKTRQQTLVRIVRLMRDELGKGHTILEISRKLRIGYRPAHNHISSMEKEEMVKAERVGNAKRCVLDLGNERCRRLLAEVDAQKKEEVYRAHPKVGAAIEGLISAVTADFISDIHTIVLFGSYAKGAAAKASDIDLLFIVADLGRPQVREAIERGSASYRYSHHLCISPLITDIREFRRMLGADGLNIGKEAKRYGIPLYGSEMFWRLVA